MGLPWPCLQPGTCGALRPQAPSNTPSLCCLVTTCLQVSPSTQKSPSPLNPLHPLRGPRQRGSNPHSILPRKGSLPPPWGPQTRPYCLGVTWHPVFMDPQPMNRSAHKPLPPQVGSSLNPASSRVASRGRCGTEPGPKHRARLSLLSDLLCPHPESQPLETEGQPVLVTLTLGIGHYTASGTQAQAFWSQSSFRELLHSCHSRWLQGLQRRQAGSLPSGAPTT